LPILVTGLHPNSLKERGEMMRQRINKVLRPIGQPAVEEIFKTFEKVGYKGADAANYRMYLFLALEAVGPECKSRENHELVKKLYNKERSTVNYRDNIQAANKALDAMNPN